MSDTKSLCAKISVELHTKVRESQEECGSTLNQYMEKLITEYYEMKEGKDMSQTKTLAIQIPAEMSVRIKAHIAKTPKLTLRGFLTGLIEQALTDAESVEENQADITIAESSEESTTDEPNANEPTTNPQADETTTDDTTADEQATE